MRGKNYIADQNRFHLAKPPKWWLDGLWDFDSSLVVVPSRQGFYYRLAQRRPLNLPTKIVNDLLFKESDTEMLASYSLIPVTTIKANPSWSPWMYNELAERAPWRQGGAQKVNKLLEERDQLKEQKVEKENDQMFGDRAKDGWKLYQAKTGQRTFVNSAKIKAWDRKPQPIPSGYAQTSSGLLVPRF